MEMTFETQINELFQSIKAYKINMVAELLEEIRRDNIPSKRLVFELDGKIYGED